MLQKPSFLNYADLVSQILMSDMFRTRKAVRCVWHQTRFRQESMQTNAVPISLSPTRYLAGSRIRLL